MFTKELLDLLIQVVKSWQVIAVTIVIFLYFSLVSFVARTHGRSRSASSYPSKNKKKKPAKAAQAAQAAQAAPPPVKPSSDDIDSELGLEE